jgi:hypothetical protein
MGEFLNLTALGLTETYTVIIRFDTAAHLQQWMESSTRARLIEKVRPLFVTGDDFFISSGLDFWFTPGGAKAHSITHIFFNHYKSIGYRHRDDVGMPKWVPYESMGY